ncbi:hypothetical protein CHU95_06075 [Niveispirillum lacus]|uniref:Uncharacterized protein n=1 Tax=Niveispirillum lacus TaxID=1981099 RepID=A0A255Z4M2_9PROT|nr:hypothetical protein [Niveispirillum lacus]OYQ35835.1 hypothetical protein CHU95_06075 [Niveispirillum lacus]
METNSVSFGRIDTDPWAFQTFWRETTEESTRLPTWQLWSQTWMAAEKAAGEASPLGSLYLRDNKGWAGIACHFAAQLAACARFDHRGRDRWHTIAKCAALLLTRGIGTSVQSVATLPAQCRVAANSSFSLMVLASVSPQA